MLDSKLPPDAKPKTMAEKFTRWVGSPASITTHTVIFVLCFVLGFVGIEWNTILLVLTTAVSLEAIYLAIFIQMTVNRHTESLESVEQDIDEIQEDIDEIQEDVGEIQGEVDEIHEDDEAQTQSDRQAHEALSTIQRSLEQLVADVERIKQK